MLTPSDSCWKRKSEMIAFDGKSRCSTLYELLDPCRVVVVIFSQHGKRQLMTGQERGCWLPRHLVLQSRKVIPLHVTRISHDHDGLVVELDASDCQ